MKDRITCGRLDLAHYSILYLSQSLIPSSSCMVHSFVGLLRALSLSLVCARFLSSYHSISFSLSYTSAHTHVHSSRLCLTSIVSPMFTPPPTHTHLFFLIRCACLSLSSLLVSFSLVSTPSLALPSMPSRIRSRNRARRSHSFPFLHSSTSFPFSPSHPPHNNLIHPQCCEYSDVRTRNANLGVHTISRNCIAIKYVHG